MIFYKRYSMNSKQKDFILFRADGISYDKIAKKLQASKPTLIQWSKLFEDDIKELQFQAFIQIKEAYSWNTKKRYETLLKQLNKIDEGILDADLSTMRIKDLFTIKNDILLQVDKIEKRISTNSRVTKEDAFGYKEQLEFRLNEVE